VRTKKSFSLIELIFAISLISLISSNSITKNNTNKLNQAADKLKLYLNYTRYIAYLDNKYDPNDPYWYKKRWTLKFRNCYKSIGGVYFSVFSDINEGGRINKLETLKDPINNKYLYSNGCKDDTLYDKSKYVLLTKQFDIVDVKLSCYNGSGLGYLSFGVDGKVYSELGDNPKQILEPCIITLKSKDNNTKSITVEPTGYIY
jgi:hypothetical protein